MTETEKTFVNNSTPTIQEEVITLRIENAELEEELDSYKALDSHYDEIEEDAKVIAKENKELKAQIDKMKSDWAEAKKKGLELLNLKTMRIKQLEAQIEKMKCCYNCKYGRIYFVKEIIVDCLANKVNPNNKYKNCDKWELAK